MSLEEMEAVSVGSKFHSALDLDILSWWWYAGTWKDGICEDYESMYMWSVVPCW